MEKRAVSRLGNIECFIDYSQSGNCLSKVQDTEDLNVSNYVEDNIKIHVEDHNFEISKYCKCIFLLSCDCSYQNF